MNAGTLYYKRKYSTYNFTVYSLKDAECYCYMWHEGTAKRGSCEIATGIQQYIQNLPPSVERLVCFSDTCAGQNRNVNLCAMLVHMASIKKIMRDHIYMEKGHIFFTAKWNVTPFTAQLKDHLNTRMFMHPLIITCLRVAHDVMARHIVFT